MPVSRILDATRLVRGGMSNVELSDITAALISKKQLSNGSQADPESAEELRVGSNRLSSLVTVPSSFLHTVVSHITVLDASHNQLRDFSGLELFVSLETLNLSDNQVQVLDASSASVLLPLRRLQTVILSHNNLKYVDWDVNANNGSLRGSVLRRSQASMSGEFSSPGSGHLVDEDEHMALTFTIASLDLSHNELIELPDLRTLPLLEELYLEDNDIEDLTDLEIKVPLLHLQTLTLAHNGLATCAALVPLAALGESVLHLTLDGNPFTADSTRTVDSSAATRGGHHSQNQSKITATSTRDNQRRERPSEPTPTRTSGWWRPFVLFLVPLLITLDETDLSDAERRAAGYVLFRQRPGAPLSRPLLELMNPQRSSELETYLLQRCVSSAATVRGLQTAPCANSLEGSSDGNTTAQPSLSNTRATAAPAVRVGRHNSSTQYTTPTTTGSDASPNGSIQDGSRNGVAAPLPVVVKAIQSKLKHVTGVVQILWQAHVTASTSYATPRPPHDGRGDPDAATIPPNSARSIASSSANADMHDVVTTMRTLQQVMTNMWGDLDDFRTLVAREQYRAALTIQRYYRGYRARCEWRVLHADYHAFISSLTPDVCLLQRVGRGLLTRLKLGPHHEMHALRREVRELRRDMTALKQMVHQRCLSTSAETTTTTASSTTLEAPTRGRYADPVVAPATAAASEEPAAFAPLRPARIMVHRRSSSGGSYRGSSLPQGRTAPKPASPAATAPRLSKTPDHLDDQDEL